MKKTIQILSASIIVALAVPVLASANFLENTPQNGNYNSEFGERDSSKGNFHEKRSEFKKLTLEEKIEKVNSNEEFSDEQKEERIIKIKEHEEKRNERKLKIDSIINSANDEIKAIHNKRKNGEEITKDEKEIMKSFFKENGIDKPGYQGGKKGGKKGGDRLDKISEKMSKKENRSERGLNKFSKEEMFEKINSNENLSEEEKAEKIKKVEEREVKIAEKKAKRNDTLERIKESVENNTSLSEEKKSEILEKISNILSKFFN